jgi:hypothetical protein
MYINGIMIKSGADTTNWTQSAYQVGNAFASYPFYGLIDDLRVTKGIARYRYNFIPPAQSHPDL